MALRNLFIFVLLIVSACNREPEPETASAQLRLDLDEVLGSEGGESFLRADEPREFDFPRDHGGHPAYRNEWWYLTGNLATESGRRFGYQVTFFRAALRPPMENENSTSDWQSDNLWMAHAALTDVESGRHVALERFSRENPGLAGVQTAPFRVWLENWSLSSSQQDSSFPWQLELNDPSYSLHLTLTPEKDLVLQGDEGLSQKSPIPGNASYYYSFTRLNSAGELTLGGDNFRLTGDSWLDREWSTSALAPEQSGWDWFSLQFDDGRELMYYRLLDVEGEPLPTSRGNWTDRFAEQTLIRPRDIRLEAERLWQGPDGNSYVTQWQLHYRDRSWRIEAVLEKQFMQLSLPYWEGAVEVRDMESGESVGHGYLEMVRE